MKTFIRQMKTHNGRMYELFYWLSRYTDFLSKKTKLKLWIDKKEFSYWYKWIRGY